MQHLSCFTCRCEPIPSDNLRWLQTLGPFKATVVEEAASCCLCCWIVARAVLCAAGAPPACGAVLWGLHQAAATHDRHRVPPWWQVGIDCCSFIVHFAALCCGRLPTTCVNVTALM